MFEKLSYSFDPSTLAASNYRSWLKFSGLHYSNKRLVWKTHIFAAFEIRFLRVEPSEELRLLRSTNDTGWQFYDNGSFWRQTKVFLLGTFSQRQNGSRVREKIGNGHPGSEIGETENLSIFNAKRQGASEVSEKKSISQSAQRGRQFQTSSKQQLNRIKQAMFSIMSTVHRSVQSFLLWLTSRKNINNGEAHCCLFVWIVFQ